MASETSIENQSSLTWKPVAGSLQAMNLGSMLLGQLGQLVNWRNEQTFSVPACKPGVDLPMADTDLGNASVPAVSTSDEPTKAAEMIAPESTLPPVAPPDVAAEATSLMAPADDVALQAAKAQELAKATAKAMASAAEEAAEAAQVAASAKEATAKEAAAFEISAEKAAAKLNHQHRAP